MSDLLNTIESNSPQRRGDAEKKVENLNVTRASGPCGRCPKLDESTAAEIDDFRTGQRPLSQPNVLSASPRFRGKYGCSRRSGFTLIEMATVVVIMAILTAVALPSLAQSDDLNSKAAARVVLSDLLYAQSQAIDSQQMQYVQFSLNGAGGYSLYSSSSLATPVTNPTTRLPYTVSFGTEPMSDVALAGVTLDAASNTVIAFDELGAPWVCSASTAASPTSLASTGSIRLQSGSIVITLSVEPDTGNITITP